MSRVSLVCAVPATWLPRAFPARSAARRTHSAISSRSLNSVGLYAIRGATEGDELSASVGLDL